MITALIIGMVLGAILSFSFKEADTKRNDMVATDSNTNNSPSNPPTGASGTAEETNR